MGGGGGGWRTVGSPAAIGWRLEGGRGGGGGGGGS